MKRVGFLGLLLVALLLRVSIPTGMMLVSAEGGARIVPCPSAWPSAAVAAPATHHGGHHQPPQHDHKTQEPPPCPFGVLLFPAMPSAPPLLALQAPAPESLPLPWRHSEAPARDPSYLHPPATGPPLNA